MKKQLPYLSVTETINSSNPEERLLQAKDCFAERERSSLETNFLPPGLIILTSFIDGSVRHFDLVTEESSGQTSNAGQSEKANI